METQAQRQRQCRHHSLIRSLISEVRRLRAENEGLQEALEDLSESAERERERYQSRLRWAEREAEAARREAEDASWREYQRRQALRDYELARSYGDQYATERAMRRLREL